MNAFYEHHQNSIAMHYACFDRMVLDARIFGFMQPERALGFFSQNRGLFPVHKHDLVKISNDYERWVREEIQSSQCPLLEAPEGRRDEFMEPYFTSAQADQIVGIIKAREPVRILTAVGFRGKSTHLELKLREPIQLLHSRPRFRPHVCACLTLFSIHGAAVSEPP